MFPFTPKHVSQAKLYLREAAKLVAYRKDIAPAPVLNEVRQAIDALRSALSASDRETIQLKMTELDQVCAKLHPPLRDGSWKENVEVFIVAITVALGIRTYFVQPFTIPTGSMQPTLNGIQPKITADPAPNAIVQAFQYITLGRTYFDLVSRGDESIQGVEKRHYFNIPLELFTYSAVRTNQRTYTTRVPVSALNADSRCTPGRTLKSGDIIARGYSNTGDHVLVDKLTYHFLTPKRSQVFVFNTRGIPTQENRYNPTAPSQYYIKRIAGVGGDTLRIEPPTLHVNGAPATETPFQRVMAGSLENPKNDYRGYSNGPEHGSFPNLSNPRSPYHVPKSAYFALGDNSYHSSDSRDWGIVPERNVMGRGWMVYWPFTTHWGFVQ